LIAQGHREIGIICGQMNTYSGRERYIAYVDTLHKHGLPLNERFVLKGDFLKETAYEEIKKLLSSGEALPTAFFSSNDDMAISALEAFSEHGVAVPEDISIVGFDDIQMASRIQPKLTTVKLPIYEMSKAAVEKVIELCNSQQPVFSTVSFPARLIERDSCQPPKNK
jgi:LacI family transcriptional regulator